MHSVKHPGWRRPWKPHGGPYRDAADPPPKGCLLVSLSIADTDSCRQATYTAQILYVAALYLARLGVLRFLLLMARDQLRRRMIHAGTIFSAVSGLAMLLALVFQCSLPQTWAIFSAKCIDKVCNRCQSPTIKCLSNV